MMDHPKMISLNAAIVLCALVSSVCAFGISNPSTSRPTTSTSTSTTVLPALIYGWDGVEEEADTSSNSMAAPYTDLNASEDDKGCTPLGAAVAESLSYDRDRAGHLARLAVAFSPPERALTLAQMEHVEVLCVHDDSIDIQAILCEDGGCVSLSVPVAFPRSCYAPNDHMELQGCVLQNLQELDAQAGSILVVQEQQADVLEAARLDELDGVCELSGPFEHFPGWWVPPECYAELAQDCHDVRNLLNEDEFQADVCALAQEALRNIPEGEDFQVLQAKVAFVGPAGICFKVRAEKEYAVGKPLHVLEVVHPFDQIMYDVASLRAAVLGAVAAA